MLGGYISFMELAWPGLSTQQKQNQQLSWRGAVNARVAKELLF